MTHYVGTEHLLLGLLREQEGVAAHVLMQFGLTIDRVRAEIMAVIGRLPEPAPDAPWIRAINGQSDALAVELPPEIRDVIADLSRRIWALMDQKETAVAEHAFDLAAALRSQHVNLARARDAVLGAWRNPPVDEPPTA